LAEVSQADEEINLARAAIMVAQEEYPQLPEERYLGRLDLLAEGTRDRLDDENAHLVVLEVGWRLGLPLEGVSFPGHFLVRFKGEAVDLLIDPYDGGAVRFEDEAQELLDRVYGGMIRVQDSFLKAATKREMLVRLLMNLKSLYLNGGDHRRALAAVERVLLIRPIAVREIRDKGVILARLGRKKEALEQFEAYLNVAPEAADSQRILGMMEDLKGGFGQAPRL
jgi:regulator of sirC expression with transglutaminase-like and TPR domain